jgi:hypothetical protein
MNLTRYARLPLLLLFTLLQGVAPVAHAHVNGHHTDQHVHLAYLDHIESSVYTAGLRNLSAETDHSSVVSMPPEYRPAELSMEQSPATEGACLLAPRVYATQQFVKLPRQSLPFFPYQHPCSQAPPA